MALAQPAKNEPIKPAGGTTVTDTARSADPLGTLLSEARTAHGKLRDYTGTFTRQERVNGTLSAEQVGEIKARVNPYGVHVRFLRPESLVGMEVGYSAAKRDGKVRYRATGVAAKYGVLKLEPNDPKFMADNRHPATEWGIGPMIEVIAAAIAREKSLNNPVEVFTSDYQFAHHNVVRYEILMRRPHALRYAAKMVVFLDKETKLAMRFEAYDEPKAGAATGEVLEVYSFTDLKYNTGVGENTFDF